MWQSELNRVMNVDEGNLQSVAGHLLQSRDKDVSLATAGAVLELTTALLTHADVVSKRDAFVFLVPFYTWITTLTWACTRWPSSALVTLVVAEMAPGLDVQSSAVVVAKSGTGGCVCGWPASS